MYPLRVRPDIQSRREKSSPSLSSAISRELELHERVPRLSLVKPAVLPGANQHGAAAHLPARERKSGHCAFVFRAGLLFLNDSARLQLSHVPRSPFAPTTIRAIPPDRNGSASSLASRLAAALTPVWKAPSGYNLTKDALRARSRETLK
ncbi:hypothetical protein SKAU_G00315160 [Synaphobranchus kaupii]|uniref:Uncharacterized protein n=1 Tax=Synaphobranchus kaupii TaxID=118154 RepID=A0A9Q1ILM5_SYNKA|nr:hypothetical protein SKAU_G00315160 [Synaphobranchus kaupii]